jgi:hypothetical protein
MVFYGIDLNGKIDNLNAKIGDLQRQVSDNKQQLDEVKDKADKINEATGATEALLSLGTARSKARDARRLSDMRQLVSGQEMYYGENDRYLTSATFPAAIGTYITATPKDPQGSAYGTVSNVADSSSFCYYAKLENPNTSSTGCTEAAPCGYYTSTQGGNFYKTVAPTTLGTTLVSDCAVQK